MTNNFIYINSIINSNNYQLLIHRKKGEWLEADSQGELHSLQGKSKIWFVIKNIFCLNTPSKRIASAIDDCCKSLFSAICHKCLPLDENQDAILLHKKPIMQLVNALKRIRPSLYDKETWRNLKHLLNAPEIVEAKLALDKGKKPTVLAEGISGSYILYNRLNQPLGIFKPGELEAGNGANPKGYDNVGDFLNLMSIQPGTSFLRERAVYLIDREHFADVPKTVIARFPRKHFGVEYRRDSHLTYKGSFQKFVPDCKEAWDHYQILPSFLSNAKGHKIPVHDIHKIAILDIRTLNCDRHLKNFLVDSDWHTHPIDHGFTLPGNASSLRFNWMNFTQSKKPFSKEDLAYIERLDPEADAALLKRKLPSLDSAVLSRLKIAGLLLKKGAKAGLTPYQIGELMIGKAEDALTNWINFFVPVVPSKPSYFETNICKSILTQRRDIDACLDREIADYLRN